MYSVSRGSIMTAIPFVRHATPTPAGRARMVGSVRPRRGIPSVLLDGRRCGSFCFSSFSSSGGGVGSGERLRIAIVGGGAAGLSTALHLAPLAQSGHVAAPIDVFSTPPQKRDIGVGLWSTALDPFVGRSPSSLSSPEDDDRGVRDSHHMAYRGMTDSGTWVGDVGYRTPNGAWLMKSRLPTSWEERERTGLPALLFLRERDLLTSLEKAVHWEQLRGTVQVHQDSTKLKVIGLEENSSLPWSARLRLEHGQFSARDYHVIVAADGTHSLLRQLYGGHQDARLQRILTGTADMHLGDGGGGGGGGGVSPMGDPRTAGGGGGRGPTLASPGMDVPFAETLSASWTHLQQQEAVGLQDRHYTVFRGNSPLSHAAMGATAPHYHPISFQTWGQGRNMRFATVPMSCPAGLSQREERQVWFITIDDHELVTELDPSRRKELLLHSFEHWHDPIRAIVETTPAEEILMERAIAHRHSMAPVTDFNRVVEDIRGHRPPNSGQGPCLVFVGDANMTVDPILAQGFTVAMEGAHALASPVHAAVQQHCPDDASVAFHPYALRRELAAKYEGGIHRILCLLRATELVQTLGQPAGGTVAGLLNLYGLRPITRILPNALKAPIFDATLKYSLGLLGKR